jgi:hypothetical protein
LNKRFIPSAREAEVAPTDNVDHVDNVDNVDKQLTAILISVIPAEMKDSSEAVNLPELPAAVEACEVKPVESAAPTPAAQEETKKETPSTTLAPGLADPLASLPPMPQVTILNPVSETTEAPDTTNPRQRGAEINLASMVEIQQPPEIAQQSFYSQLPESSLMTYSQEARIDASVLKKNKREKRRERQAKRNTTVAKDAL